MGVPVREFVARVEEIAAEEPRYELGHSGGDGACDCIGEIIGAIERAGGQWPGMHGSNYAARYEMRSLEPIGAANQLSVGEVVYKASEPGSGRYDLPGRYRDGGSMYNGDLRDYYHVGVVVSVSPLRIRHMTTPRPKIDTKLGMWSYHGALKRVDMSRGGDAMEEYEARVVGGALNLRKANSSAAVRITQIPEGSIVTVREELGDWCLVDYNGRGGYVMARFLERMSGEADGKTIVVDRMRLEAVYDELGDLLGLRG